MLKFFDGDGVQLMNLREKLRIFLQVDRGRRCLPLKMCMVHQDRRQVFDYLGQPVSRDFFSKQKHAVIYRKTFSIAKIRQIGD